MAFNKRKLEQAEQLVGGILDSQEADMLVLRGKDCHVIYINAAARGRMPAELRSEHTLERGYGQMFVDLAEKCPLAREEEVQLPHSFDVKDNEGRIFAVRCAKITWLDERPAVAMYLRDASEDRADRQKLYNLAYADPLTGVPNRTRFKEDFEKMAEDIAEERVKGVVAIFDLDNFKSINDTYGHNTGDIMLKRLTQHLEADPAFKDHLYRLGGDEFVLVYSSPASRFGSDEELRRYYEEILRLALRSYTMPNIEGSCTISMGAAFFPAHGTTTSELLRKADIALYKAKENGRDQLALFEDQYDAAKKFKDLYINIQPILTHAGRTFGYELVDRGNEGVDDDALNLSEFDRTLDALGIGDIDSDARYFISYTAQLLSPTVLKNLPKDKFIVQVRLRETLESRQLELYRQLKANGYPLAVVDLSEQNMNAEILALADYVKFAPGGMDGYKQKKLIGENPLKRFVATGVDTSADFSAAKQKGFKLFQGYFFNQPVIVQKTKDIDPLKVNYFRLLQLTSTDDYVNFQEISTVIGSDVALSYKLLRLLNSAAVGLRNPVSSIEMAVAYLGEEHLKKWIALLSLRGIASDKPLELVRMSLIRAQFGELLAPHFSPPRDSRHVFLTGMLSLLHIALEKTKEELFEEIPVAEVIKQSLLTESGPYSDLLGFFTSYEYANWDEVSRFGAEHRLSDKLINDAYIAAVKWYNNLADS